MGKPGLLQSMGWQRVGHNFGTEQQSSLSLWLCLRIKLTWNGLTGEKHANLLTFRYLWKWKLLSCVRLFVTPYSPWNSPGQNTVKWVAFPFSRVSSQPGDQTQVYHIAGEFFTSWVTREAQEYCSSLSLLQQFFLTWKLNWGSCIAGRFFTNRAIREALWEPSKENEDPQKWPEQEAFIFFRKRNICEEFKTKGFELAGVNGEGITRNIGWV